MLQLLRYPLIFSLFFLLCCADSKTTKQDQDAHISADTIVARISGLYSKMKDPKEGEWLYDHKESYQPFEKYIYGQVERPTEKRKIIYIQPIGTFDSAQTSILNKTALYLEAFFGLEVNVRKGISDSLIPKKSRRMRDWGEQLHTQYILKELLAPSLPEDAMVMLGLTATDLYPANDWNYVFGQAMLRGRVGVWSMNRFGDPALDYNKALIRTLSTASHETGHMFSIPHCIKYDCCMNGSNHIYESDTRPTWLCPDCLCKLSWNVKEEVNAHLERVKKFWTLQGFKEKAVFYERNLKRLH
jgi:archaemetzincin